MRLSSPRAARMCVCERMHWNSVFRMSCDLSQNAPKPQKCRFQLVFGGRLSHTAVPGAVLVPPVEATSRASVFMRITPKFEPRLDSMPAAAVGSVW